MSSVSALITLRYFIGMTITEVADIRRVSEPTARSGRADAHNCGVLQHVAGNLGVCRRFLQMGSFFGWARLEWRRRFGCEKGCWCRGRRLPPKQDVRRLAASARQARHDGPGREHEARLQVS